MSINGLLDIGKSALLASQTALSVTSNNIANVNTPGYSRQDVTLSISNPTSTAAGYVGTGVTASAITRSFDRFLEAQLLDQQQSQGKSSAMDQTWGQVEMVFNEQIGAGLSGSLSDFFNAWNDVAADPQSPAARTVLLQKASTLTRTAGTIENGITTTLNNTNTAITDVARQVNSLATDIAKLNETIVSAEAGSNTATANDLRDQRDAKLTELSKLTSFSSYEDTSGAVTITVGMRNLVSGTRTNTLGVSTNADGNRELSLDGVNITSSITGGQLGGLIASRDQIQSTILPEFRKLTASITQQVNSLHAQGFGLDGSTGNNFFNPLTLSTTADSAGASITSTTITDQTQLTLDEYKITFSGGNYTVSNKQSGATVATAAYNPAGTTIALPGMSIDISGPVTDADSFTVSPLTNAVSDFGVALTDPRKIAAASTAAGVPGDNGNALGIAQLSSASITNLQGATFSRYYGATMSTVAAVKQTTNAGLTFDNNLLSQLQTQRDSVSGVSLDEEAAKLIVYQRAYQAAARVITVADELIQTILNI